MPFFQTCRFKDIFCIPKCVTLQVRIASVITTSSEKRVWLPASLTVEAALSLSLFLFAAMIMMVPMKMMDNHRRIQASLEAYGEELSEMAYLLNLRNEDGAEIGMELGSAGELAAGVYAYERALKYVEDGTISKVNFLRSRILNDGETIMLIMDYNMKLPFSVFHLTQVPMSAVTCRRAWIGTNGKLGEMNGEEQEDTIVYVGKGSTRYHMQSTCHYLDNNIISCKTEDIAHMRNDYGGKYSPCGVCGALAIPGGTVFVLPSGGSYHSRFNCGAISAYVKAVPLSQVAHLGACSYCSR